MIFRRTIVAETRRDSTGAFLLPTCPPLSLPLSYSRSLPLAVSLLPFCLFTTTSLCPSLIIFSPLLAMLYPSLIHVVAPSFCLPVSLSSTQAVPIFLFLLCFLIPSCSFSLLQIVPLCSHNFLLSLTGLLCPSFLYPSLSLYHAFSSHSCSSSSSSAHAVLLSHVDQRGCPGGGILTPPGACALHVQLSPFLLIPYLQLFDTRGKDLFGLFCEDRQANNKINLSINFSTGDYVIGQS